MQDVVTDLHVLEDLRHGEPRSAHQPGGREEGEEENSAAAELELALHVDELADVCGVLGAAGAQDLLAQGVELARQRLDVRGGEVCGRVRKHSTHHVRRRDAEERRTESTQARPTNQRPSQTTSPTARQRRLLSELLRTSDHPWEVRLFTSPHR